MDTLAEYIKKLRERLVCGEVAPISKETLKAISDPYSVSPIAKEIDELESYVNFMGLGSV